MKGPSSAPVWRFCPHENVSVEEHHGLGDRVIRGVVCDSCGRTLNQRDAGRVMV